MTELIAAPPCKIVDAHTHIYPQKIAEKATQNVGLFYDIPMCKMGFAHTLVAEGSKIGVCKYLVCSVATKPEQVQSINEFIARKCAQYASFFGLATLHPALEDWACQIDYLQELGLHGVKLHPDFQAFDIDDPVMMPIYRRLAERGLPVLFHTGDARYDYSAPARLRRVAQAVPTLTCVAAHFGGYQQWEQSRRDLTDCPNVFFDTSSALFKLSCAQAEDMIGAMGEDRFMFGTDFPMWDHVQEYNRFMRLKLSARTREKIFYRNFERIYHAKV